MPPDREQGRERGERGERDLERELRDLGARLDYPPTPDLARATRLRLEDEAERVPGRGRFPAFLPSLRWVAAAALVLVLVLPFLSPAVRSTMSDLFLSGMSGQAASSGSGGAAGGAREVSGDQATGGGREGASEANQRVASGVAGAAGGEGTLMSPDSGTLAAGASVGASASSGAAESGSMAAAGGGGNARRVPDVVGMRVSAACEKISSRGYVGYVTGAVRGAEVGPGRVVSQRPQAGGRGLEGGAVDLEVSEPYSAEDLRGGSRRDTPGCVDATQ